MKIAVGSTNPAKLQAVTLAFSEVWPDERWEIVGVDVSSGVASQPMSDKESIKGAMNRAKRAIKQIDADFGVGLEGGIHKIGKEWFDKGWIVVIDKHGKKGMGTSINMHTPPKMIEMILKDKLELGEINDILFKTKNSKHGDGHFGLMTKNLITRTEGYKDGVISALVRFIHPEFYE